MNMQLKKRPELACQPGAETTDDAESSAHVESGNIMVTHGIHRGRFPIGGMLIREAREVLAKLINIDPTAVAVINGIPVDENHRINGEVTMLSFVKPSAIKG